MRDESGAGTEKSRTASPHPSIGMPLKKNIRSCVNLVSFEIDRGREIDEASAEAMVKAGLQRVEHLYFTHTVISHRAVVILQGACPRMKETSIILHGRDFGCASALNDCVASLKMLQRTKPFDTVLKLVLSDE
ncbi:uncharacterized protein LOC144094811 [Amblyomma americanum]